MSSQLAADLAALLAEPEPTDGDDSPEMKLSAAMQVHGAALVFHAGQLVEEMSRDGEMSRWLKEDIARSLGRLAEAFQTFMHEKPADH